MNRGTITINYSIICQAVSESQRKQQQT